MTASATDSQCHRDLRRTSVSYRPVPMGVLVGSLIVLTGWLTGCAATPPNRPNAPASTRPPAAAPSSAPPAGTASRCHTDGLAARLGTPTPLAPGLRAIPLIYTNVGGTACQLRGAPQVELHGPEDPNGPVFAMLSRDTGAGPIPLPPGRSASAPIVVREDSPGHTGHGGSTGWTPTEVVSTPPGETATLRAPWTAGGTVLREDSSTHPDEYVQPFTH